MNKDARESWSGNLGFILAVSGSAIGLGNIWKFPYVTGMNGGGAFVLIYLICVLILGLPIMVCEMAVGRRTGRNPYGAFKALQLRRSPLVNILAWLLFAFSLVLFFCGLPGFAGCAAVLAVLLAWFGFPLFGFLSILGGLLILSYYSVVGGWILDYMYRSFSGELNLANVETAGQVFADYTRSPWRMALGHLVFILLCAAFLWGGVRKGIERWSKILMPMLFLLLIAVIVRGLTLPGAMEGLAFFLTPDFSKLSANSILIALGQSFYSLSLAMGITITYGSYLSKDQNIFKSAISVIALDTMAAVFAGIAIFPAVFAMKLNPGEGPGLIFQVLPATFSSFPGGNGWIWSGIFFLILSIAALTSGGSLLELGVTFLVDQFRMKRSRAIVAITVLIALAGLLPCFSIASWENLNGIKEVFVQIFGEKHIPGSYFDLLDNITSNWLLPLNGLFIAIFVGWIWGSRKAARELRAGTGSWADTNLITYLAGFKGEPMYRVSSNHGLTLMALWSIIIRFLAPVIILLVFLKTIGVNVGF